VLDGALPAGTIHLHVSVAQFMQMGGSIHFDLLHRVGANDTTLASFDGAIVAVTPYQVEFVKVTGAIDQDLPIAALAAQCGDRLVVRMTILPNTPTLQTILAVDLP
jgi:hypothetical protein